MNDHRIHHYACTLEAAGEKLQLQVTGRDLRHGAVHFLTSDAGMAMALRNKISADVIQEFPCNLDQKCTVAGETWTITVERTSTI